MKCPVDGSELKMTERQGVEIDYCPQCRGVWLDRGELDKIIERSATPQASAPPPQQGYYRERDDDRYDDDRRREGHYDQRPYEHKKRKSFLDEIFDF
ncbi:MAG: zf-TFIIB domain-containing protein [Anaerolineae bacterium]|nr:zf-TFIIB domain-containing protein [Anaerolineae bacterium]